MAIYKRDIVDINLETGNIHRSFLKHSIGYLDQAADHFGIRVLRNGEPVDLTGVTVQGIFMPPQGNPIAITTGNIIEENVAEVVLPQACYNYDGQFCLSIKLVDATNAITGTMRIVDGMVDNTHASGTVAPTGAVPTYQEILAVYETMQQDIADYATVVATQNGQISDLKSAFDIGKKSTENELEQLTGNRALVFKPGCYRTSTTTIIGETASYYADNSYQCVIFPCVKGDVFTVDVFGPSGKQRAYFECDSSMKVLERAPTNYHCKGRYTVSNSNAAYVVFMNATSNMASGYYAYKGENQNNFYNKKLDSVGYASFGTDAKDFPMVFDYGTYYSTAVGQPLEKYYGGGYDKTRKVIATITFNAPCIIYLKAKTGYSFMVLSSESGIITGATSAITEYTLMEGYQYGIILRSASGSEDISALKASDIVDIVYYTDHNGILYDSETVDLTDVDIIDALIAESTGEWNESAGWYSYLIPVKSTAKLATVTASSDEPAIIGVLSSDNIEIGEVPDYADGCGREVILAGKTRAFYLPSDAKFICIMQAVGSTVYTPDSVTIISERDAQAETVNDLVRKTEQIPIYCNIREGRFIDYRTGALNKTADYAVYYACTDFVPVKNIAKLLYTRIKVNANTIIHGTAFYDAEKTYISGIVSIKSPSDGNYLHETSVPEGASYARFTTWKEATREVFGDFLIYDAEQYHSCIQGQINEGEKTEVHGITHFPTTSEGQLNVIRRCRQMTDIKWTPAVDIPRISQLRGVASVNTSYFEDVFKAGVQYTGLPYGQATRHATDWGKDSLIGMKVGWTVGFDTFISAVSSPESIVAKDSVYVDHGAHNACFYAMICTALCGYAFELSEYYPTALIDEAPGMTDLGELSDHSLSDIQLGDMVLNAEHGAIITDKIVDKDGTVTAIEISEATTIGNDDWNVQGSQYGGICRRRFWTASDFTRLWSPNYRLYRYEYLDSVTYTKCPYVDTGDEGDTVRTYIFPVLPYMGENFEYVKGHIVNTKILTPAYREGQTNKLRVKKDGTNWNADGTTNYYDVSGLYVEVGFVDEGEYEAYLCKVSNGIETITTRPCHWKVVREET